MEINKFDGKSNFSLWQARVKDVLIQQGLIDALLCDEKPTTMEVRDWKRLQMQAVSTIRMYLTDEVVIHVLSETSRRCCCRSSRSCTWRSLSPTLFSSGGSFTNCG